MGGLLFGYDIGITGGVTSMEPFLKKFFLVVHKQMKDKSENKSQYCKFDNQLLTLFTSSLYLAATSSLFFASTTTRMLGRKISMLIGGLFFLVGSLLNGFAMNIEMLIIGRILLGFGVGFCNRHENGWRLSLGPAVVPTIVLCIGSVCVVETPNSLIERGKYGHAKEMLRKIRGTEKIDEEYQDLVDASETTKMVEHPWKNIGSPKYRPQLIFCTFIPAFQQLTGINVIMFYASVLFQILGFGNDASLMSAVIT
ncbi:hypothetical protein ACSQ67_005426 [Phaseolus vulgaris]